MTQKPSAAPALSLRKPPKQRRSAETIVAIVEASARILETRGFAGFNTNAVAELAGVSIGSLYQYFPGKQALLAALIEREMAPLTHLQRELAETGNFKAAMALLIRASVQHQMCRPELARLLDQTEKQEPFHAQVADTAHRMHKTVEAVLRLPGAPPLRYRRAVAVDLIAIIKALTDTAGEQSARESKLLFRKIAGAIDGYLNALLH